MIDKSESRLDSPFCETAGKPHLPTAGKNEVRLNDGYDSQPWQPLIRPEYLSNDRTDHLILDKINAMVKMSKKFHLTKKSNTCPKGKWTKYGDNSKNMASCIHIIETCFGVSGLCMLRQFAILYHFLSITCCWVKQKVPKTFWFRVAPIQISTEIRSWKQQVWKSMEIDMLLQGMHKKACSKKHVFLQSEPTSEIWPWKRLCISETNMTS